MSQDSKGKVNSKAKKTAKTSPTREGPDEQAMVCDLVPYLFALHDNVRMSCAKFWANEAVELDPKAQVSLFIETCDKLGLSPDDHLSDDTFKRVFGELYIAFMNALDPEASARDSQ